MSEIHEDDFPTRTDAVNKSPELDPKELDCIAQDIQRDVEAGNGLKHFEDLLDNSTANTEHVSADERERMMREESELLFAMKCALNERLLPQGLRCKGGKRVADDAGPTFLFADSHGREYKATLEAYPEIEIAIDARQAFEKMINLISERALDARRYYFKRMGVTLS